MKKTNSFWDGLTQLVFPENLYCICCGDMLPQNRVHGLCDKCISDLKWISENPFEGRLDDFSFDSVLSLVQYDYYSQKIIHDLKFHGKSYIAKNIGTLMGELFLQSLMQPDDCSDPVFIPVPMYFKKERLRGYNQAALLARQCAVVAKAEYYDDILLKTRATSSMRTARAVGKLNALDNSMALNPEKSRLINGRNVVLVDDVITTGATAERCSLVLRKANPCSIKILSFAAVNFKG